MDCRRPKATETLGVELEADKILVAQLKQVKGRAHLLELFSLDVNSDSVKPLYKEKSERKILNLLSSHLPVTGMSCVDTLIRPLFVQLKKERDIDAVIEFQAEPLISFPIEEAVVDWSLVSKEEEGSDLSLFVIKKERLIERLETWKRFGFDPECVTAQPMAIAAFTSYFYPEEESFFAIYVGDKETTVTLIFHGRLVGAQSISVGAFDLVFEDGESEKKVLDKVMDSFSLEVMKTFLGLSKHLKGKSLDKMIVLGKAVTIEGFLTALVKRVKKEVIQVQLPEDFVVNQEMFFQYAIPIGLALSALPLSDLQVNFRKKELAYPKPWKRLKKPVALFFFVCLLFSWGIYTNGLTSLGYKEDLLKEKFGQLLVFMDKPYDEFEKEFEEKKGSDTFIPIETLSYQDLHVRLEFLEEEIKKMPEPIALMPNTPRVSDFLAWLATHPSVVFSSGEKDHKKSVIEIQSFNYTMQKRPEEKKRDSKYRVKIDLEFSSPTPKLAREFHDALIEDNDVIDVKDEVKWSSSRGRYRTSFFLKDKTYYPVSLKERV